MAAALSSSADARGVQRPLQRIVSDFLANPVAIFGLGLLALVVLAAIFAPLISPQNPYDLAQLDVMDSRLPPGSPAPDGGHLLARHRRPGPRHAVRDLLRPAHFARRSA